MLATMMSTKSSTTQFLPSDLANLVAWFRFGVGITVTGSGVSQWSDQTANVNHLLQATDGARPPKQGDGSILFDGAAQYLQCNAFTLNQPETIYLRFKAITWVNGSRICDGNGSLTGSAFQDTASPNIDIYAGLQVGHNTDLAVGTYGSVCVVFNGASSLIQVGANTPLSGNAGASNMGGFTVAAGPGGVGQLANIQVKEIALYAAAHDAATRATVITYLNSL